MRWRHLNLYSSALLVECSLVTEVSWVWESLSWWIWSQTCSWLEKHQQTFDSMAVDALILCMLHGKHFIWLSAGLMWSRISNNSQNFFSIISKPYYMLLYLLYVVFSNTVLALTFSQRSTVRLGWKLWGGFTSYQPSANEVHVLIWPNAKI